MTQGRIMLLDWMGFLKNSLWLLRSNEDNSVGLFFKSILIVILIHISSPLPNGTSKKKMSTGELDLSHLKERGGKVDPADEWLY